jgi:transposase-like protein
MGLEGISKSEVSRICARLDGQVEAFRGRPLVGRYPYLWLDATYEKVRDDSGRVVSMALVVAYGVAETGEREVLGLDVCRSEDYAFWRGFLSGLVSRGLSGVKLVVSDGHKGLKRAVEETFLGAGWQRCRVHFLRNILSLVPKDGQGMVLAAVRLIFGQPDKTRAREELRALADRLQERLPRVSALLLEAEEEILAHMDFPAEHWKQISSTNPLERLNKEINRRTRVVGIFPDEKSLIRLIGAVLCEQNDEWAVSRKYMSRHSLARIYQQDAAEIEGEVTHAIAIPIH